VSTPWSTAQRATVTSALLAALIFVPWLGSVGLWDPWETHYAEVAREMLARGDFVHPHWEQHWFFSKPALTMWLQALGMVLATRLLAATQALVVVLGALAAWRFKRPVLAVLGVLALLLLHLALRDVGPWRFGELTSGDGALPPLTEWGVRLPFALCSVGAVASLAWALSRTVSPRVGFLAGVVLATMPLFFLLARQAVTDPLLVGATVIGVSCALVALFDEASTHRGRWAYGAWAAFAAATLAKGWLGFLLPGAVFAAWLALFVARWNSLGAELQWTWRLLRRPLTWALPLSVLTGAIARQFARATGTTFISGPPMADGHDLLSAPQWVGLTWAGLALWLVTTLMTRATTQPAPPVCAAVQTLRPGRGVLLFLGLALPWYYAMFTFPERDDEGKLFWVRFIVHDHLSRFVSGVHTTTPGGSFTYFLEQGGYAVFPWVLLVPGALAVAARVKVRGGTQRETITGISALWLLIGWLVVGDSATKFHHYVFPLLPPLAVLLALFVDEVLNEGLERHAVALALGVPLFLLVGKDLWTTPKNFTDLFVYNYDRPWPDFLVTTPVLGAATVKDLLKWGALGALALVAALAVMNRRRAMVGVMCAGAFTFATWFSWSQWPALSNHWTQRDLFLRYMTLRQPGEPIAAFLMNWRGETFYSRSEVVQVPAQDTAAALAQFLGRSKRTWLLVEHARLPMLKSALGGRQVEVIEPMINNKFALLRVD
jgi:4-amino-4-deoxy-L-arabinose transferase-like glycosyltransferase